RRRHDRVAQCAGPRARAPGLPGRQPLFPRQAGGVAPDGRGVRPRARVVAAAHRPGKRAAKKTGHEARFFSAEAKLPQTMSFNPFSAATFTVFDAGFALNIIFSPVNGLMPSRAFVAGFFTTRILSSPGSVNSPGALRPARLFLICLVNESNTAATSFFVRPVSSAMEA